MGSLRNFLQKTFNLVLRASTKITTIFFFAITATVAGGLFTFFTHDSPPSETYDERVPASVHENSRGKSLPGRPPGPRGGSFAPSGASPGGMPLDYDARANNQGNFTGGEQIDPANANLSSASSIAQGAQQRAAAEALNQLKSRLTNDLRTATSTSSSTSSSTSTGTSTTGDDGSSSYGGSATATSTATATTTTSGPRYLNLTASGSAAPGLCVALTLTLYDANLIAAAAGADTAVSVTTTGGSLYSNVSCGATTSSVTVPAGASYGVVYFKSATSLTVTVTAQHDSLGTSSVSITAAQAAASVALGQADLTSNTANAGGLSGATLNGPYHALRVGSRLVVADSENHRVLIWATSPSSNAQAADIVLGQPNLTSNTANNGGLSAATLSNPDYVASDGTRLFVADRGNNRVLVWSSFPTANQQAADFVLGQPDFTTATANTGGVSAASLNSPECVHTDGTRLLVCDRLNNRVLLYSTLPFATHQGADVVLGQADSTSNSANAGGAVSAVGFDEPNAAFLSGSRLFVADASNHRVLVWSSIPTSHGASASVVIGQPSMSASAANNGGLSASTLSSPGGLAVDSQGRLAVADYGNNRVLVWNQVPTYDHAAADTVIGQTTFTANTANSGGISATSLSGPWGLSVYGSELWVADNQNHRVLLHELP